MVTSTLQAVLILVVGFPLVCLLLGLFIAFLATLSSKPKARAEWEAKVRQHGYLKALVREALGYALFMGLLLIVLALWQVVGKACGRAQP